MSKGKVYLVGAGPGDPGLITIKAVRCLESADAVVYDRLVDRRILDHASPSAELIDVGKFRGGGSRQSEINALLVELATSGKVVVRLKGGDPFVFGRGGEEAEALAEGGIPFEVVPGVTSAIAAPAYAGIPVTHRGLASSVTFVTGSEAPDKESAVRWDRLAQQGGTLVILMGWENLAKIVDALVEHGRPPETPVALVRWGTEPVQQTVTGTLRDIAAKAERAKLSPPVVAIVGEVVRLRERLRWFDNRPLFGKRVLVTRTRAQAGALSAMLAERGAQPIELPTIEIKPLTDFSALDDALRSLESYGWVVFTSANAVEAVFSRLHALGQDARAFGRSRVAAIGPATAESLRSRGIAADFVPDTFVAEEIVEGFRSRKIVSGRVLLPRADIARRALQDGLSTLGLEVDEVAVYHTVAPDDLFERARAVLSDGVDIVAFTSSSTVKNLVDALDGDISALAASAVACIGPITADTARELGIGVDIVAREYTIEGLVESLESYHLARYRNSEEDGSHE
ncbi:MAG: uroporphyrinogen-III C-methyltransferase [Chloroflexi bacterium]|nr:uroporphyrinogen-III C-methyltransferase [Chloroflexota bacterium]